MILYPQGKISPLQEKLFCTLGGNIHTVAIDGDFDACQALVKQAFDDRELKDALHLNSANSINISRLLAQICYYFEAVAQLPQEARNQLVISVPSGNFGDLTAGLLAKSLGLPVKRFIAATNANDTVPRFLTSGQWQPHATVATLSNAMDVSQPNNWPRVEELFRRKVWQLKALATRRSAMRPPRKRCVNWPSWVISQNRTRPLPIARCAISCRKGSSVCSSARRIRPSLKRA